MKPIELLARLRQDAQCALQIIAIKVQEGELREAEHLDQGSGRGALARPFLKQLAGPSGIVTKLRGGSGVEV